MTVEQSDLTIRKGTIMHSLRDQIFPWYIHISEKERQTVRVNETTNLW